jgi:hypothetical protein
VHRNSFAGSIVAMIAEGAVAAVSGGCHRTGVPLTWRWQRAGAPEAHRFDRSADANYRAWGRDLPDR